MIYSYDKVYLRIAQRVLGEMLNYAVYDCGYELNEYYRLFTESSYSERFSKGDPFVIAGMSGAELAIRVMDVPDDEIVAPGYYFEKSPEYWTGWLLAYYQWMSGKTFAVIQKEVPVEKIRDLYHPYHEMDITQGDQNTIYHRELPSGFNSAEQGRKLSEVVTEKSQTQSEPACGGNRDSRQDDSAV